MNDGDSVTVNQPLEYNSKFTITCSNGYIGQVSQAAIAKPPKLAGSTENLGVRAETMIAGGQLANVAFPDQGTIRCRVFYSANDVIYSIINGLSQNKRVPEHIVDSFRNMVHTQDFNTISWNEKATPSEKNELGKYVGELLIGVHGLAGHLEYNVDSFVVPVNSNFVGIDSFFMINTNTKGDHLIKCYTVEHLL